MQRYPSRSRLSKRIERQSKKTLFFSIIGIIIVLFLIIKVGLPLLIRFSLLVGDLKDVSEPKEQKQSVLLPPQLSPLPQATNSATIKIDGIASKDLQVEVFLNNDLVNKSTPDENGKFTIEALRLNEGQNLVKAREKDKTGKTGEFSEEITIIYDKEPPKLELSQPSDNQVFSKDTKTIIVAGKSEGSTHITVNGFWAVIDNNGNFSYTLSLTNGENKIKVEAADDAGNKTTIERKVTLSQ